MTKILHQNPREHGFILAHSLRAECIMGSHGSICSQKVGWDELCWARFLLYPFLMHPCQAMVRVLLALRVTSPFSDKPSNTCNYSVLLR